MPPPPAASLYDRIYAAHAASTIANSMGDITEHLTWDQIETRYGLLDRLLPQGKKPRAAPTTTAPTPSATPTTAPPA